MTFKLHTTSPDPDLKLIEREQSYLNYLGLVAKNLSSGVCEQHRRRPDSV